MGGDTLAEQLLWGAAEPLDGTLGVPRAAEPAPLPGTSESRAIIRTREGLGRLERARTPGPGPAGEPSAAPEEPVPP